MTLDAWPTRWTAILAAVVLCGCSTEPPIKNDVRDPGVYARSTQTRVVRTLEGIAKSPAIAQQHVDRLVGTLERYPQAPVGENEAIYADLLAAAQDLKQKVDARAESIQPELDRLAELAQRLPVPPKESRDPANMPGT